MAHIIMNNNTTTSASKTTPIHLAAVSAGVSGFELDLSSGTGAILGKYKDVSESEV